MLRAVIIDDEEKGIDTIQLLLKRYIPEVKTVAFTTSAEQALELIENYKPEIVFLDINMPEMDGFELLENLNWKEFNLVFTTAHQEYALRALKNNAIDYLLKPIDHRDLKSAVDRIQKRIQDLREADSKFNYRHLLQDLERQQKNRILVGTRTGIESIALDSLIYLQSDSNYTSLVLEESETIITTKTLKEFEGSLCVADSFFMRVHQSYVINLNKVIRYLRSEDIIVMSGDYKIPLSRSRKDAFLKWLDLPK